MPPPRAAKISIPRFSVPTDTEDFRAQTRDLCLMHDVFMRACFQHSLLCVQVVLRVILRKDLRITKVTAQKSLTNLRGRRSIVMDILAEDEDGLLYNVEVQVDLKGANPRRPRYHLSAMDMSVKKPGKHFERLPEAFSIFLVAGDPFGAGKPIYVFTRRTEDGLPLGDGTTIIYVNVLMQDVETELGRLCHDFCCTNPDDMYFPELAAVTRHFKEDPEGASIMGNMSEDLFKAGKRQGMKEGERKGLKQGETKEKRSTATRLLAQGKLTLEEIAAGVDLTLTEVRALSEQLRGA